MSVESRTFDTFQRRPDRFSVDFSKLAGPKDEILPVETISYVYTTSEAATTSFRDDPEEQRARIDRMNRPHYIREMLFRKGTKNNGTIVHEVALLNDGGQISFVQPSSPYAVTDILVNALPSGFNEKGMKTKDGKNVPYTYGDLPDQTRFAYNASKIELLVMMDQQARVSDNRKALIMENSTSELAPTTSQSIGVPHFHATMQDLNRFEPNGSEIPGAKKEDDILQDDGLAESVIPRLERYTTKALAEAGLSSDGLTFVHRGIAPFGFSVIFAGRDGITADNALTETNLQRLHVAKEAIYRMYGKLAPVLRDRAIANGSLSDFGIFEIDKITEQPSLQEIIDVTPEGYIRLTESPVVRTRRGPSEKMHVELARKRDPKLIDGQDEFDYRRGQEFKYGVYAIAGNAAVVKVRGEVDQELVRRYWKDEDRLEATDIRDVHLDQELKR